MTDRVIQLADRKKERIFPRELFHCADCFCRTFKICRSEGVLYVECANCERDINFEDL